MSSQLAHLAKVLLNMEEPETQTTVAEREALKFYSHKKLRAVEIGVFEGVNTCLIAASIHPNGTIYGIDPFTQGRLGVCYGKYITMHSLRKRKLMSKVTLIEKPSYSADMDVQDPIDFLFIDGDHSYEGIRIDWVKWSTKVAINGIVALHDTAVPAHDTRVSELGSFEYYNEVIRKDGRFEHLKTVDSLNVLKRAV